MKTENAATTTETAATVAEQGAKVAPEKGSSKKTATPKKGAPKGQKTAKAPKPAAKPKKPAKKPAKAEGVREGSKTAKVIDLLKRSGGATLSQIMKATDWQAHSVRGFISGTLGKKMGLTVESTKGEDGARVYSITK
jgi:hypothetical protein